MKDKETLLKEYFKDIKPDFIANVRYDFPDFDSEKETIVEVNYDKYYFGNVLIIYPDSLEEYYVTGDTVFYSTNDLKRLARLYERTAKLIEELRKADPGWLGKPEGNFYGKD